MNDQCIKSRVLIILEEGPTVLSQLIDKLPFHAITTTSAVEALVADGLVMVWERGTDQGVCLNDYYDG
jgi:hypothetical protein